MLICPRCKQPLLGSALRPQCGCEYDLSSAVRRKQIRYDWMILMPMPELEALDATEWHIVKRVVASSFNESDAWQALSKCRSLEIYTDGSAPIKNPGGPAGFSTILVGFAGSSASAQSQPEPAIVHPLGGYISARKTEPKTSNNRAEIAGVLAAYEAVRRMGEAGVIFESVRVFSDSTYTVNCGNGIWQRKKNTGLWQAYDRVLAQAKQFVSGREGIELVWVKGHAANRYNNMADEWASRAAFDFDERAYTRFRAAQVATGREMPGPAALLSQSGSSGNTNSVPPAISMPPPRPAGKSVSATEPAPPEVTTQETASDYAIVVHTQQDAKSRNTLAGTGLCNGTYKLITRTGREYKVDIKHPGQLLHDEGEYLTLLAALEDLMGRLHNAGRDPSGFSLTVYSGRELVTKQLSGEYKVKSPQLQPLHADASHLLGYFAASQLVWQRSANIAKELGE